MTAPLLVAVHGATGAQGRPVVDRLLAAGHRVRALARSADPTRLPAGVEPVAVDLLDPDPLVAAYTGADAVVAVLPGGAGPDVAVRQADAVLTALARAGVPRAVVNTGGGVWSTPPGVGFLDARTRLVAGLPDAVGTAIVLQPAGGLMENLAERWVVDRLRATGELVGSTPPDAPTTPVAMADLASAAVDALTGTAPPAWTVVHGPAAVTGAEIAARVAAHLGRPVTWTRISPEEHLRGVATGLGERYAANIAALYGAGARVPPPDPPPSGARHVRGATALADWVPTQRWT